ncbi:MAG TPA: hypothetical protein VM070_08970 [Candidatus Saccharimonadales bacterium]|nr:hypothetical protein [Candidatus Saccharimonadales bacterium]
MPPEPATYRFEQSEDRSPIDFALSTRTEAAWTFRSQHVPGSERRGLPTLAMRFAPVLDDDGATTTRLLVLPIHFERPPGTGTPLIIRATLEASFDDGAHFTRVPIAVLGDRALAIILHPPGPTSVTLRGDATDLAGNRIEQTITRAYLVREPPALEMSCDRPKARGAGPVERRGGR